MAPKLTRLQRLAASARLRHVAARILATIPLDPAHPAVVALIHWVSGRSRAPLPSLAPGLAALTLPASRSSPDRHSSALTLTRVDRSVLTVAHACCAAGKLDRAEALLNAHVQQRGEHVHPSFLERLAAVHLAAGDHPRAESVLRSALRNHPTHAALHLTLADTYVREGKWTDAVARWERVADPFNCGVGAGLLLRMARAYRKIGRAREALACASKAAAIGPPGKEVQRELEICSRLAADWPNCLLPVDTIGTVAPGRVEAWGFLAGQDAPLEGRIGVETPSGAEIQLRVNGFPVATTWASQLREPHAEHAGPTGSGGLIEAARSGGSAGLGESTEAESEQPAGLSGPREPAEPPGPTERTEPTQVEPGERAFAIHCGDLLRYLGDGDIIAVAAEDKRLELPGGAIAVTVRNGLPSRFPDLKHRLEAGFVFTKTGQLKAGHTRESKRETLDFYVEVAEFLEARTGLSVYPFYGNLLGAIRDNDFIEHDVDGFDMLVLCQGREPEAIKKELFEICSALREQGYHIEARPWCLYIRRELGRGPLLDLSYGWFNEADELNVSFGWRYMPVHGRSAVTHKRPCRIADRMVSVPVKAERVLEQLYGPNWRVPSQGYTPTAGLIRDERYLLTEAEMASLQTKIVA